MVPPEYCVNTGVQLEGKFYCTKVVPSMNNIFFLETSCAANQSSRSLASNLNLTEKIACAVYSAAFHNPNHSVILMFTCTIPPVVYDNLTNWVKTLVDLPNFFFGQVRPDELYADTSLRIFSRDSLRFSPFPTAHHADLLRLYLLYLFGGTYMDLDVISLRPLDGLGVNYVGQEAEYSVANGFLNFEAHHTFLKTLLKSACHSYQPKIWGSIGPVLVLKTLQSACHYTPKIREKSLHLPSCNVTVYPMQTFFAVSGESWRDFYDPYLWEKVKLMTNESFAVHYWNHEGSRPLIIGSEQPLIKIAEQHCAGVLEVVSALII